MIDLIGNPLEPSGTFHLQGFQNLMRRRIRDVLLVSSLYDSYLFEEDGQLYELIHNEYQGLSLSHSPEITRVSGGEEAIALVRDERRFDLVITTLHLEDLHPLQFAKMIRETDPAVPIILLAFDNSELATMVARHDTSVFDRIFVWQGDFRLLIAIVKHLEDRLNVAQDTGEFGVQSIILIEDNIRFYSAYLPLIYTELLAQSRRLIAEGVNISHRYLRMRARPKILLCTTYEEAWTYFEQYEENILGIISDVDFHRNGSPDPHAGLKFARSVRDRISDIPILLQSHHPENRSEATALGVSFVLKDSATLLHDVREFMLRNFGFGDFVFQTPDGREVGRAGDLKSLEEEIHRVPEESLQYHGERNHFSKWLKARTEFWLAHQLRPRKVSDYPSLQALREDLIRSLQLYRQMQQRGLVTDFSHDTFDPTSSFARIGGGSLGGKARGLGFLSSLLASYGVRNRFKGVEIFVPVGVVLGTDVFDAFLELNDLGRLALHEDDDQMITDAFLDAEKFPRKAARALGAFLQLVREPLAVRSSSLLEDSRYQPFAGVYETYMVPNNHANLSRRLKELLAAVKRVYASTFYRRSKEYMKATAYRLEEEKMAVVIQRMVGAQHGDRFYPEVAGVARSYNFYPLPPQRSEDGIASVALGLGKMVVDGGPSVRFCPRYPAHLQQFSSTENALANNQHQFFALDLTANVIDNTETHDTLTRLYPLGVAEKEGTLWPVGSTYSDENDAIYDGLSRPGMRLVTMAPILKNKLFPLPEILQILLELGSGGMGTPVEIEFAVSLSAPAGKPVEFGVLQIRPLVVSREFEELSLERFDRERLVCQSAQVLGNGIISDIYDIIVVDIDHFDRSKSREVAFEVERLNARMVAQNRPYLLVGVGRWGTLDPWLGIPVRWDQISGAKAIVEAGFKDVTITPSQGSHFFQNLTAFSVGYFTVNQLDDQSFVDWNWLLSQPAVDNQSSVRHLRFDSPVIVKMNGHEHRGLILKPE